MINTNYLHFIFFLIYLGAYFLAPSYPDKNYISILFIVLFIEILLEIISRKILNKNNRLLSIGNLFLLGFLIVYLQAPLDFILGYNVNVDWFYDLSILCPSISFSMICFSMFLMGYSKKNKRANITFSNNLNIKKFEHISFFICLSYVMFFLFVLLEGFDFFIGGYGAAGDGTTISNTSSLRFFNYLTLCLHIVVIMIVWNVYHSNNNIRMTFVRYIKIYPPIFLILFFSIIILWLTAGGRMISISLFLFFLCGYIVLVKYDMKLVIFLFLIVGGGYFFTILKNIGGLLATNLESADILTSIQIGSEILNSYAYNTSFLIPTRELSFSIYVNNLLYSFWNEGGLFYGLPLIFIFFRSIPGFSLLISSLFNVDIKDFSVPYIAQVIDNSPFGLGNSCIGEILVSIGFVGTIIFIYLFGVLFRKLDDIFSDKTYNLFLFILLFLYFSESFMIPRFSLFTPFSDSIMIYIIMSCSLKFKTNKSKC